MNAIVHTATHSFTDWVAGIVYKLSRSFDRVGYARAAAELARLGYIDEARHCILESRKP